MHTSYKNLHATSHQIRSLLSLPIGPTLVPSGLLAVTAYDSVQEDLERTSAPTKTLSYPTSLFHC